MWSIDVKSWKARGERGKKTECSWGQIDRSFDKKGRIQLGELGGNVQKNGQGKGPGCFFILSKVYTVLRWHGGVETGQWHVDLRNEETRRRGLGRGGWYPNGTCVKTHLKKILPGNLVSRVMPMVPTSWRKRSQRKGGGGEGAKRSCFPSFSVYEI